MDSNDALVVFDDTKIRRYWSDLKIKLAGRGFRLYEIIVQLKLPNMVAKVM